MDIQLYIDHLNRRYQLGNATEHTFRGDLQQLIESIVKDVSATNEPKRISCGAPDYIIMRKEVPVGYIEAKDIGVDLNHKSLKEQFERYKASLSNLIFTDYIDFHFYKEGIFITKIAIGAISNGKIVSIPENFEQFTNLLTNFSQTITQTIKSPTKLAEMMAGKARLMADVIEKSLDEDDAQQKTSSLKAQMQAFKDLLIHDIDNKAFSDIYAQTIAYGMFAARYHDPTLPTFSRQEAATLIPKSNPFLRKLFQDIAGYDLDERLLWMVEELVSVFLASDVADIMRNFGTRTKQEDPVIHFYETFLAAYNPALRKARGVWYTPQPVVNFIVRAVDDILKTEFNLKDGLADTSKTKINVQLQATDKRYNDNVKKIEQEVHKVQILDPATGTGTFLAEVVKHIYKKFEGQQGIWNSYVEQHLIPRLNGFELLMASYAMAHLKMDMLLTETGFKATQEQRTRIFLTNSLEESHPDAGTLFASWLSDEANQANKIKRDAPVMCVIGNPPYSVSSNNKSEWIENLIINYKKGLNERKINLDDDYIKFIRFGQYFIDKNGEGILAYISNNSFIDGITHRQMRKHLLESFDSIYILDLHGNARKRETCPDGTVDNNVFDIMQGVSINIFVKTGKKKKADLGKVFHYDLFGKRELKYDFLNENSFKNIKWNNLNFKEPSYFFVPKDFDLQNEYDLGFKVSELFKVYSNGIETKVDLIATDFSKTILSNRVDDIFTNKLNFDEIRKKYSLSDRTTWEYKPEYNLKFNIEDISQYYYRPFDFRFIYYNHKFLSRSRKEVMRHLLKENISLCLVHQSKIDNNNLNTLVASGLVCKDFITNHTFAFPLYLYPESTNQTTTEVIAERTPNLNVEIVNKIAEKLGLQFVAEKENHVISSAARNPEKNLESASNSEISPYSRNDVQTFSPTDILDYIYAVLHSPTYREKYKEFLKIDFPRVPFPQDLEGFRNLQGLGAQLRQLHLLESEVVDKYITQYPIAGDNVVSKIKYENGNVYINDTQYFANVPAVAWNFYIGGYQPAQKWLKDRKDRTLGFEDILHYQKIIVALTETDKLMKEIDKLEIV